MDETEEEEIQRLVKEGIAKAKQDEKNRIASAQQTQQTQQKTTRKQIIMVFLTVIGVVIIAAIASYYFPINPSESENIDNSDVVSISNSDVVSISKIINNPENYINNNIRVSGTVKNLINTQSSPTTYTSYFQINDGTGSIWIGTQSEKSLNIIQETRISADGFLMDGFTSSSLNRNFDLIVFASPSDIAITTPQPLITTSPPTPIPIPTKSIIAEDGGAGLSDRAQLPNN